MASTVRRSRSASNVPVDLSDCLAHELLEPGLVGWRIGPLELIRPDRPGELVQAMGKLAGRPSRREAGPVFMADGGAAGAIGFNGPGHDRLGPSSGEAAHVACASSGSGCGWRSCRKAAARCA